MGSVQGNRRETTSEKTKQPRQNDQANRLALGLGGCPLSVPSRPGCGFSEKTEQKPVSFWQKPPRFCQKLPQSFSPEFQSQKQQVAAEASEVVEDEVAAEASDAVESSDIPTWCDPSQNLAAFLLFPKLKCWCVDNGYGPEFGPYGSGCPADDVDNALDAGASETVEEEVSLEDVLAEEGVDYDYVDDIEAAVAEARRRKGRSQKRGRSQKKGKKPKRSKSQKRGRSQRKGKSQRRVKSQKNGRSQKQFRGQRRG